MRHKPVLLQEVLDSLAIECGDRVLDATVGSGGHSLAMLQAADEVELIGLDADGEALKRAEEKIAQAGYHNYRLLKSNFRYLPEALKGSGVLKVDKALFDLGMSSDQLDSSGRGFSFQANEPLLMTFDDKVTEDTLTAKEIVNNWEASSLQDIFRGFGEERYAGRIARAIVEYRQGKIVETTEELAEVISRAVPSAYRRGRIHPATRCFQALRMTVNDELTGLRIALEALPQLVRPGRVAVISFHSLEDRMVKGRFREWEDESLGRRLNKKPIIAGEQEIANNPRSRSAKLRTFIFE